MTVQFDANSTKKTLFLNEKKGFLIVNLAFIITLICAALLALWTGTIGQITTDSHDCKKGDDIHKY